jgi:class 3 adenylate cyclase
MPLFIDRHSMHEYTPEQVAEAHLLDLAVQERYGANFFSYFYDYPSQSICCVVDAPSRDAVLAAHRETCGPDGEDMPTNIIEVSREALESFLGTIKTPRPAEAWDEIAFRTIVWIEVDSPNALIRRLGDAQAAVLFREQVNLERHAVARAGGREVRSLTGGLVASFVSASRAIDAAIDIRRLTEGRNLARPEHTIALRIGLNAGEPVTDNGELFGSAVQIAEAACHAAAPGGITVSGSVHDICLDRPFSFAELARLDLDGFPEPIRLYGVDWQPSPAPRSSAGPRGLSTREIEVLRLIAGGKSNQQVADELVISINTVIRHVSNIYTKAGLCNRAEAATFALTHGIA